ncbi:Beta-L-arabinobiosidase precursor [Posidoniimonas corsicana]|uniref:Beta-L-arabinobiosidase n=1 Tax=Posidoniimonas corsicana TaxID=1938618 RepID=A0A5C5VGG8_9BACT|nr:discoidin domain-containing protein [Posidoniimonas corsicana]TWT36732.1 Beta-L-arabinobiosidase precursor [Posidoniimonas corsicana]
MLKLLATAIAAAVAAAPIAFGEVLDKQQQLQQQTFWDNQDWRWYSKNIPFFECSEADITTTYYYRWELLTKHLTYGSPNSGYSFTEFIDRPFWSGAYGAISCPAGHQLYEARWLRSPRIANDYSRYWHRTPGAQPRNYSTWLADSAWAVHRVHPDPAFVTDLLADLVQNFERWEQRHFVEEVGLFWQTGHDDGMEFNINSRQTQDILRGAPSYRPSFNAYMWADAVAIARIATLAGQPAVAARFEGKAAAIKQRMIELLWDDNRRFFFPVFRDDEERDGHTVRAMTKTYESGRFAGDPHGRELIGYVPWQFNMIDANSRFDVAWKKLMDRDGFYADYGPSTVERNDPMFLLKKSCCWWSGQSWPFATSQTLKALANALQAGELDLSREDYVDLLQIFARSHRKNGRPYLAEALHPDTGSFEGHDAYNHSEHYLHSSFCDLVITGLAGLRPRDDDALEVRPLALEEWDYFALDDAPYRGHLISIVWDKTGDRYGLGPGLRVLVDGRQVGAADGLEGLVIEGAVPLAADKRAPEPNGLTPVNFAVNNDGHYYPRLEASHVTTGFPLGKIIDGNYWYHRHPPNRWTCEGTNSASDWLLLEFGKPRVIHTVKLYLLDDSSGESHPGGAGADALSPIRPPERVELESLVDGVWSPIVVDSEALTAPAGHRPTEVRVEPHAASAIRVTLHHSADGPAGLTELEVWGDASLPVETAPPPAGNLAYNPGGREFPRASASHSDRFGGTPENALDGRIVFSPTPTNRWTSYESGTPTDWLMVEFGEPTRVGRLELYLYDDRGGVQTPRDYRIEFEQDGEWRPVTGVHRSPADPTGGARNTVRFDQVETPSVRVVFTHQGDARSGLTELEAWAK